MMPTRLGNVLRKYEREAGSQYGLDADRMIRARGFSGARSAGGDMSMTKGNYWICLSG